jgi:hypothetical protein
MNSHFVGRERRRKEEALKECVENDFKLIFAEAKTDDRVETDEDVEFKKKQKEQQK